MLSANVCRMTVHPHACGEYVFLGFHFALLFRFIPTRVGNTGCRFRCMRFDAVHPHACGEYLAPAGGAVITARFIPTRVGNTCVFCSLRASMSVHPHACGEYAARRRISNRFSRFIPTRVGNTFIRVIRQLPLIRFIPTRVGNTPAPDLCTRIDTGSSPRVWGIRTLRRTAR